MPKNEYFAHSGIHSKIDSVKDIDISVVPNTPPFNTLEVNANNIINGDQHFNRIVDSENKILSEIANSLGSNHIVTGEMTLYTYLKPCVSCDEVFASFKQMYPNIKINIIYERMY